MTSNEDAEIRKHGYKPLKRRSPTPLYYPLISVRGGPTPAAAWNMTPESGALFGGSLRSSNHLSLFGRVLYQKF